MSVTGERTPEPMVGREPEPATVRARLARARRSGNPDDLWPDVSRNRRIAAGRAIAVALGEVLAGRHATLPGDAASVGVTAFLHGVGPLLGHWLASGRLDAPPDVAATLAEHLAEGRGRVAAIEGAVQELVAWFAARGIEPIMLKGRHLADTYPEPGARVQSDVDLLLPARARDAIEHALRAAGWYLARDDDPGHRASWTRGTPGGPRRLDRVSADDPWSLDVHWTLDRRYLPGVVPAGSWDTVTRDRLRVGTTDVAVLGPPDLAYLTALHASLNFDELQLSRLVDLALLARRDPATWDHVLARADVHGTRFACFPAAALLDRLVPDSVPPAVLAALRAAAPPAMRAVVSAADPGTLLPADRRSLRQKFMWSRTALDHARVAWRLTAARGLTTWRRRLRLLLGVG